MQSFLDSRLWAPGLLSLPLLLSLLPFSTLTAAELAQEGALRLEQCTPEAADDILRSAEQQRQLIHEQYIGQQRACHEKFFVSSCLEDAKERNRVAVKQVRDSEVSANVCKRQAKADERDKVLAAQRIKDEQDDLRRAEEQKAANLLRQERAAKQQQPVVEEEEEQAGQENPRVKAHEARVRKAQEEEAAKAPQRAANERAYREKVKRAELHRQEMEAKKAAGQRTAQPPAPGSR